MPDAHDPRPAEAVADNACVPACGDYGMLNAARLQDADAAIHRVTFCNTAEVDAHAFATEAHTARLLIELEIAEVHAGEGALDLPFGGLHMLPIVVEIADARVRDVERTLGDLREMQR